MQNRFAGQPARVTAVAGQVFARVNGRISSLGEHGARVIRSSRLSVFQSTLCIILAVLGSVIGFTLISIRNNTVLLNANMRESTRALAELRADVARSADTIDRRVADTNQKLFDLVVEVDDLIAAQKKLHMEDKEPAAEPRPSAKPAAAAHDTTRTGALTVHRRHGGR